MYRKTLGGGKEESKIDTIMKIINLKKTKTIKLKSSIIQLSSDRRINYN